MKVTPLEMLAAYRTLALRRTAADSSAAERDAEAKRRLQIAIAHITPVRNEIAHVREAAPEKLQRANLACADILAMLVPA